MTASADRDDDVTNESATLTHTAVGDDYNSVTEDLPVTVTDTSARIVLSKTAITVEEEGEAVGYTVKLAAEPTGPVEVTITGAEDTTLSVVETSLDFTVDDWNIEQAVDVSADHDDDESDNGFTLTHTASGGGGYDSAPQADLQVTVADHPEVTVSLRAERLHRSRKRQHRNPQHQGERSHRDSDPERRPCARGSDTAEQGRPRRCDCGGLFRSTRHLHLRGRRHAAVVHVHRRNRRRRRRRRVREAELRVHARGSDRWERRERPRSPSPTTTIPA